MNFAYTDIWLCGSIVTVVAERHDRADEMFRSAKINGVGLSMVMAVKIGGMTGCTGAAVNIYNHIGARVTGRTRCIWCDRGVTQAARRIHRCMVVHVFGIVLIRMTIQTISGIGTQDYCINNLLSWAFVTGKTGTVPVGGDIMLGFY